MRVEYVFKQATTQFKINGNNLFWVHMISTTTKSDSYSVRSLVPHCFV